MSSTTVEERFGGRIGSRWRRYVVGGGELMLTEAGLRLELRGAEADVLSVAQMDEGQYATVGGRGWRPPVRLTVRARWSHPARDLVGTSGFGFWNDPWGPGGFVTSPAWVWFAHYSPPSHVALSTSSLGHGPRGSALAAPRIGRIGLALGNLALRLPGVRRLAVKVAGHAVQSGDVPLMLDLCAWHEYTLDWQPTGVTFAVDGTSLGHVAGAPAGPLGFVAWIDNQWAALRPDGAATGGYLSVPATQWLEIAHITISMGKEA
jgi:hypothetical protein